MATATKQGFRPPFERGCDRTAWKIEGRGQLREGRRWSAMTTTPAARSTWPGPFCRFILHFLEMCVPMCVGFAIGDLVYFWAASKFGYSHPFNELPELSVLVVTFTMTAPMVAWMLYRGMPRRLIAEMAAAMPVLGAALLVLGSLSVLPRGDLALWEHGLMMPAMLVPCSCGSTSTPARTASTKAQSVQSGAPPLLAITRASNARVKPRCEPVR